MELYFTIAIIAIGIFLFVKDYFSIDTTSILIMALFIVTGVLSPEEGFSGFNHPATLTLGCMFVVSAAIFKSGLIDGLSHKIIRLAKIHYFIALILFCLISATFSAFINDTAVVALLIPMVLLVCRETGINPSRLMIPISFAALFGGTCTLIGTSTNLLVSGYAQQSGIEPFGMFEFTMPALCLLGIGLAYIFIVGPFLLPKRGVADTDMMQTSEKYIADITIIKGNKDIGRTIEKAKITNDFNGKILGVTRNGLSMDVFDRNTELRENDTLKVLIGPGKLAELKTNELYEIPGEDKASEHENAGKKIYEMMIPTGSYLQGNSLKQMKFRSGYHSSVIAIRNRNETITYNISDVVLKEGDMLLVYGEKQNILAMVDQKILVLLSEYERTRIQYKKAIPALLIGIGVVAAAAFDLTSILISAMVGCILLVTTAIIKPKEAYEAIEWKVIFMMAGVLSMGTALEKTGGADIISDYAFSTLGTLDPRFTLSLIFLVTFLSTNVLSSKATAALMTPIVISLSAAM